MTTGLAKDAFIHHNNQLACEFYEMSIKQTKYNEIYKNCLKKTNLELFYGYGDSLARLGRLKESFDVYAHICNHLYGMVPIDRLKHLAMSLVDSLKTFITWRTSTNTSNNNNNNKDDAIDPLLCSICEDILKYPVTSICGHTFCRQCCFGHTQCSECGQNFTITSTTTSPNSSLSTFNVITTKKSANMELEKYCVNFEQDILIRRLIEKWWEPQLRAAEMNDEAERYLENNLLEESLKCCNQSLEYGKYIPSVHLLHLYTFSLISKSIDIEIYIFFYH